MSCTILGHTQTHAQLNWIEYSLLGRLQFPVQCQVDSQGQSHVQFHNDSRSSLEPTWANTQKNIPKLLLTKITSSLPSMLSSTLPSTLPCLSDSMHLIALDCTLPAHFALHFQVNTPVCTRCHSIVYLQLVCLGAPNCSIKLLWTTILIALNCTLPVCLAKFPLAKSQEVPLNANSGMWLNAETHWVEEIQ